MKINQDNKNYILGIDVETSGSSYKKNGLLSIGCSLQDEDSNEIDSFQVNLDLPKDKEFEKGSIENFWSKNQKIYDSITTNTIPPEEAMNKFCTFLSKYEQKYQDLLIISDNPSFDIAWINFYLDLYTSRKPMNYGINLKTRQIWDSSTLQKNWLCIKMKHKSLFPPKGHKEKLGLKSKWSHDHNPLNDARVIASFYNQTIKQMKDFLEKEDNLQVAEKIKKSKEIEILDYNPEWPKAFKKEEVLIKNALGNLCFDIFHIGSTSVPQLSAKPIIDIIAVVKDITKIEGLLEKVGYKYKGEYNLPLRSLYGKKEKFTIYLHVHEKGSPEIELNLKFRDFLRDHFNEREEYNQIKQKAASEKGANILVSTGITKYNLRKNNFIQRIIKASGFRGLCPRLCTQTSEWDIYNSIINSDSNNIGLNKQSLQIYSDQNSDYHLVLYRGTEIVAAAQFDILDSRYGAIRFIGTKSQKKEDQYIHYFLKYIEKLSSRKNIKCITVLINEKDKDFFINLNYKIINNINGCLDLIKII